jgi:1-pyrroline-5-carboxylate dehydrogenase
MNVEIRLARSHIYATICFFTGMTATRPLSCRAADLAATKYRARLTAASMLGAGKNVWQAEIDGAVEMCDFWRFGVQYAQDIYGMQPTEQPAHTWNRMEYRALEGFVVAVSPFNFVAIGANLPSSPAIMGNVALWKPANTSLLANYIVYQARWSE